MVRFEESIIIKAPPDKVKAVYAAYENWHHTFSGTIASAHLLKKQQNKLVIDVQHKKEGWLMNELSVKSASEIALKEWKRMYDAEFLNHFNAAAEGTLYKVEATIFLKGIAKLISPLVKWIGRKSLLSYVLLPLKKACEN